MTNFLGVSFKHNCLDFIRSMGSETRKGFYRYSFSGDLLNENTHWGLGNTVFAVKALYMLGALGESDCNGMASFISTFQDANGFIADPLVAKKSLMRRCVSAVRSLDFNNIANIQTKRAETRQAFAALLCLGKKPQCPYPHIPYTKDGIKEYVHALNWRQPWGAASHISHLVFFLHANRVLFGTNAEDADELIDCTLNEANLYRRPDGSWYAEGAALSHSHRVNAAMKMMTAYAAAERSNFGFSERLIDLSLTSATAGNACNNFNVICVLYHCSLKTNYRSNEIKQYSLDRLRAYEKYYWPEYGGFSFNEGKASDLYYWARVSKGLPEPDIHGTVLFLWGISLISQILGVQDEGKLNIPIT